MPDYHHLQVATHGDVVVVRFATQKLSDLLANEVAQELHLLTEPPDCRKLLLNFTGVVHVSSAMLGKLLLLNRKMNHKGGKLRVCEMTPDVRSMFVWSKLETKDTEAIALKGFAHAPK